MKFLVNFLSNLVTFLTTKPSVFLNKVYAKNRWNCYAIFNTQTMIYKTFHFDIQNLTKTKVMAIVVNVVIIVWSTQIDQGY